MQYEEIIQRFELLSDHSRVEGMKRVGIKPNKAYGVSIPDLRKMAKEIGKNHELAMQLWESDTRETRILACMIDDPEMVSEVQMDSWAGDFDYWEVCDQCCMCLFEKTAFAYDKAVEWTSSDKTFTKRAGFVLMARLVVSDKRADDERFESFFPIIERETADERNDVKKAVNWALRQIGKRSIYLNKLAIQFAEKIQQIDSRSARWIASDALRELKSEAVQKKLRK